MKIFVLFWSLCSFILLRKKFLLTIVNTLLFVFTAILLFLIFLQAEYIGVILYPVLFAIAFYIGKLYPYRSNMNVLLAGCIVSIFFLIRYTLNFDLSVNSIGRIGADNFDINNVSFCLNLLLLQLIFQLTYKINFKLLLASLVVLVLILLTGSRAAYAVLILPFGLLMIHKIKHKFIIVSSVLASIIIFVSTNTFMVESLFKRFTKNDDRDVLTDSAINIISNSSINEFLFGRPPGYFMKIVGAVTHNDYLQIFIEWGAVFVTCLYLLYAYFLVQLFRYGFLNKNIYISFIFSIFFIYVFRGLFSNFYPLICIFYYLGSFVNFKFGSNLLKS